MPLRQRSRQLYRNALNFKRTAQECRERGDDLTARVMERASEAAYERARDRAQIERLVRWAERNQAIFEGWRSRDDRLGKEQ